MHDFREQLASAVGDSRFVVGVFLDIRGFSTFAGIAESAQAAIFLKKFYLAVLEEYLSDADFAKPTGDGLMVIYEYVESDLAAVVDRAVSGSIRLIDDYPEFLSGDLMLTFEAPPYLGVGVARDAATRLSSAEGVLDYSGRPLNLAARLMDLARPSGLVLDSYVVDALTDELKATFTRELVYLKGVSPHTPKPVFIRPDWTTIPDAAKRPLARYTWYHEGDRVTVADIEHRNRTFRYELDHEPAFPNEVVCQAEYLPPLDEHNVVNWIAIDAEYVDDRGTPSIDTDMKGLKEQLRKHNLTAEQVIDVQVSYRIPDD